MPDEPLVAAATDNKLTTAAQVLAHARRMLRDGAGQPMPAARAIAASFHTQWLDLRNIDTLAKDPARFPGFASMRPSIRQETERFTDDLFWGGGTVADLFGSRTSFVNASLATLYKMAGVTGTDLRKTSLDASSRRGLLTQASLLALTSGDKTASPIHRGHVVRDNFLCTVIPAPPDGAAQKLPAESPMFKTERDRYAAHSANPVCAACHRVIDPVGFSLSAYDAIGGFRTQADNGTPIDGHGDLLATDVDGPFANAVELADRIASSRGVQTCVTRQWYRFMSGRDDKPEEACVIEGVAIQVAAGGGRLEDIVLGLTQSESFLSLPPVAAP
jgi:hypothetical protein